ncbi:fibronectin type III domain-containing protein [Candidatus Woesearchaeota archaeon]|nr:fibronectin type III domain-containing protein [Candidatus Woesearchaeota archaeon]
MKGQMIGQVFIYLVTLLLVSFLLFYGYRTISAFNEKTDQVSYIQFKNDLQNTIKTLSLDFGSVKVKQFTVPDNINAVCFVRNFPSMPSLSGTKYPIIEDSVNSGLDKNVFLISGNVKESFFAGKISSAEDLFCVPAIEGKIKLRMEGMGDHTSISPQSKPTPSPTPTTPPTLSNGQPTGISPAGTTSTTLRVTTDENANCKYSTTPNVAYASMPNTFSTTGGAAHSTVISGLVNGRTYSYYARCQDATGNANSNDYVITFSVASTIDATPPVISSVTATGITSSSATIPWNTGEPATSQIEYGLTISYGTLTSEVMTLVTSHSVTLTGLTAGTLYHYRVKSKDASGNLATSDDFTFTTPPPTSQIIKPTGIFSSSGAGSTGVLSHSEVRGVLVRALWSDIEPTPGVFDFSKIDQQVTAVKNAGKSYSLAVGAGGPGSPAWLMDTLKAPYITYLFRGTTSYRLPLFWDATVQDRLNQLAQALGNKYGSDASLKLVYVSQMTANGIEGHLSYVDMTTLKNAGYTDDKWVEAGKQTAKNFANAFPTKAIAFEVHEINGGSTVPSRIINDLWNDASLGHRVGAAMWWISGKTNYQSSIIDVLKAYPGDIYGQVIGRSDETTRFQNNDYGTVFTQAKEIGLRYIEPWEYEFKPAPNGAGGEWDAIFKDFNQYADTMQ